MKTLHPGCRLASAAAAATLALLAGGTAAAQQPPLFEDICQPLAGAFDTRKLTTGDIQGDGLTDVAAVGSQKVTVWTGTPEGLSSTTTVLPTGIPVRTGLLADLDDNGLSDLVLLAQIDPVALVAWSKGDGTFTNFTTITLPAHGGTAAVGDVTGDGRADLLVAQSGFGRITVVPGLGNHQFGPSFDTLGPLNGIRMHLGDTDADGRLDALSVGLLASLHIRVSASHGLPGGAFAAPVTLFDGSTDVGDATFVDANLDGLDDALIANDTSVLDLRTGLPDGTLAASVAIPGLPLSAWVAAGDFSGDGVPDVLVGTAGNSVRVALLRQTGAGLALDPTTTAFAYDLLQDLSAGDVDGDGIADAISREGITESIEVLIGQQAGGFRNGYFQSIENDALVLDVQGDGRPDLVGGVAGSPSGRLRAGQPDGAFGPATTIDLGPTARRIFGGDVDEDGDLDVLVVQDGPPPAALWALNDGDGHFTPQAATTVGGSYRAAAADDLDGDGRLDVVISTNTPATVPLLSGAGGQLVAQPAIATAVAANDVAAGDFDGAGWHDVAILLPDSVLVARLQPGGPPILGSAPIGLSAQHIALGNFDGDGRADILISPTSLNPTGLGWIEADPSGAPVVVGTFDLGGGTLYGPLSLSDIDGDGIGELLMGGGTASFNNGLLVIRAHAGLPAVDEVHPLPTAVARLAPADADGDGVADVIVLGSPEGPVSVVPGSARRWHRLGHSLAGGAGLSRLEGVGPLVAGQPVTLRVEGALPSAAGVLVLGTSVLAAPFKGGVLVPDANVLLAGLTTDGAGALSLSGTFPAGVPANTLLAAQVWFPDGAGPKGFSATWGITGTSP